MSPSRRKPPRKRPRVSSKVASPLRKISETLLDFAEPLLVHAPGQVEPQELEHRLLVPITIWNAIVMEERGGRPAALAAARALVVASGQPLMVALFDTLVARKRSAFADDHRLIGRYRVYRAPDGTLRVEAEAR